MEPARTERVKNPKADKVLAARIVPDRDPAGAVVAAEERAAVKAKVKAKAADKVRAAVVAAPEDAIKIVSTAKPDSFYPSQTRQW